MHQGITVHAITCIATAGQSGVGNAEGVLITWLRRRNGCARVTTERFALLPDGIVHIYSGTRKQSRPGPQPSAGCCMLPSKAPIPYQPASLLAERDGFRDAGALQTAAESLPPTAPQPPVLVGMKHELNEMEREVHKLA